MGVQPPYLFDAEPASVAVRSDFDSEITTMSVSGRWGLPLWRRVSATVRKCLGEHPRGLIVGLAGLDDAAARSGPTWLNAYRRGMAMDPPVLVAICSPAGTSLAGRLRRAAAGRYPPLFARTGAAHQALASGLPLTERLDLRLVPDRGTPARARRLVREACEAWHMADLVYPAQLVASELVSNVVEHAGGDGRLLVARRGDGVHVAVADGSRTMPRMGESAPARGVPLLPEGGRGLRIVHEASSAWGAMPITGGKVVWATVRQPVPDC